MNPPKKQKEIRTSLPYCLYKIDTRFFKVNDSYNTKICFTKEETTPNRRTQVSRNIEAIRDRWGIEAHSDVLIFTDKIFNDLDDAEIFALEVLNEFIKLYRYYDEQAVHLVPLIQEDFFGFRLNDPDGTGTYGISLAGGMQVHDPMRVQGISDSVEKSLIEKEVIPLWKELILNAEQCLYEGDYRHSILEGVIALEVVMSDFITKACTSKGISPEGAKEYINNVGLTGNVKVSLKLHLDSSIALEEDMLTACRSGITIRNKIVHEGRKVVTKNEAEDAITNGKKLIKILLPVIETFKPPTS